MTTTIHNIMNDIIQFQPAFGESFRSAYDFPDVTFKKDFGPWKRGDRVELLCLSLDTMTLSEFDIKAADDRAPFGNTIFKKSCELTFVPKETHEPAKPKTRKSSQRK